MCSSCFPLNGVSDRRLQRNWSFCCGFGPFCEPHLLHYKIAVQTATVQVLCTFYTIESNDASCRNNNTENVDYQFFLIFCVCKWFLSYLNEINDESYYWFQCYVICIQREILK